MTTESAQAFAERLNADKAFQDQLAGLSTPEDRLRMAKDAGYTIEPADIDTIRSTMGVEDIADEDLERVAGGMTDQEMLLIATSTPTVAIVAAII
jgi:predicted ribosomally synthesized peptide with nif11-like leader